MVWTGGFLFGCSDGAEAAEVCGMGWEARGFGLALGDWVMGVGR